MKAKFFGLAMHLNSHTAVREIILVLSSYPMPSKITSFHWLSMYARQNKSIVCGNYFRVCGRGWGAVAWSCHLKSVNPFTESMCIVVEHVYCPYNAFPAKSPPPPPPPRPGPPGFKRASWPYVRVVVGGGGGCILWFSNLLMTIYNPQNKKYFLERKSPLYADI